MRAIMLAGFWSLGIAPCWANDSTAELKTGGLVLTKTSDIDMLSEDLSISAKSVSVRYRFLNHSSKDITTLVAFPMPDITPSESGEDIAIPEFAKDNFLDFETAVNGAPVQVNLEQHAVVGGFDQTEFLRGLGIPLLPFAEATFNALDRVPKERWPDLISNGLAAPDTGDGTHLQPRWTLRSAYSWQQKFPAASELMVEHHYKPSLGGSAGTLLTAKDTNNTDYIRRFCIEPGLLRSIEKTKRPGEDYPRLSENRISYILKSGANWASPIGEFRLVIDKGDTRNLVSFCGDNVRKISPTRFEMRRRSFMPEADIDILILVPSGK